jgi:hypothetical protein
LHSAHRIGTDSAAQFVTRLPWTSPTIPNDHVCTTLQWSPRHILIMPRSHSRNRRIAQPFIQIQIGSDYLQTIVVCFVDLRIVLFFSPARPQMSTSSGIQPFRLYRALPPAPVRRLHGPNSPSTPILAAPLPCAHHGPPQPCPVAPRASPALVVHPCPATETDFSVLTIRTAPILALVCVCTPLEPERSTPRQRGPANPARGAPIPSLPTHD